MKKPITLQHGKRFRGQTRPQHLPKCHFLRETGLVSDVSRRLAVQRDYTKLQDLDVVIRPHRIECLAGIRAWIPQDVVVQIRDACPNVLAQEWTCPKVDIDDQVAEHINEKLSTDQEIITFRLREQELPGTVGFAH